MTERLAALLREEAGALEHPAPDAGAVLARGRRERDRRRVAAVGVGIGAVAATTAVVLALQGLAGGDRSSAPDPAQGIGDAPFYAVGNVVYLPDRDGPGGADAAEVAVDDTAIKSMYSVASGIVVRHGDNAYSDGGGPQRFSLIDTDGTAQPLELVTEETVHATDPAQDLIVYGENVDDTLFLVLYDAAADAEALRVDLGPTRETWFPVALDGDTAYLQDGYDGAIHAVDTTSGEAREADVVDTVWELAGGHVLTERPTAVVDIATGESLLEVSGTRHGDLSPDGRFLMVAGGGREADVFEVATGDSVTVPVTGWGLTWAGGHDLFSVDDEGRMTVCDAATGACESSNVTIPAAPPEECFTETTGEGRQQVIESWCEGGSVDIIPGAQTRES